MEDQNQKWINVINACTIFACTIFCSLLCFLFFLLCCIHVCVHVHMMCTFFRWSCYMYRYYRDDECPSWKVEAHHTCTIPFCRVPLWTLYCSLHHTNPTPRFTSRQEALGTNTFPTVVLPVPLPWPDHWSTAETKRTKQTLKKKAGSAWHIHKRHYWVERFGVWILNYCSSQVKRHGRRRQQWYFLFKKNTLFSCTSCRAIFFQRDWSACTTQNEPCVPTSIYSSTPITVLRVGN